jgi:hypothetical protein
VEQAGKGSAFAAGLDVAKHPDRRRAVVCDEQRVVRRMLVGFFTLHLGVP